MNITVRQRKETRAQKTGQSFVMLLLTILLAALTGIILAVLFRVAGDANAAEPQTGMTAPLRETQTADWSLLLINDDHPIPSDYQFSLETVENGYEVDDRIADALTEMLTDARAQGLSPLICSAYRSEAEQQRLFEAETQQFLALGFDQDTAQAKAQTGVKRPGRSEHNAGLAVDIVSEHYQLLDNDQADTPEAIWLLENCARYGFILRYPQDKQSVTKVIYEPWHFRYVGDAAEEIMAQDLCLEEYWATRSS